MQRDVDLICPKTRRRLNVRDEKGKIFQIYMRENFLLLPPSPTIFHSLTQSNKITVEKYT